MADSTGTQRQQQERAVQNKIQRNGACLHEREAVKVFALVFEEGALCFFAEPTEPLFPPGKLRLVALVTKPPLRCRCLSALNFFLPLLLLSLRHI